MNCRIIDTGSSLPEENMKMDRTLLRDIESHPTTCILHLYDWNGDSATYGYFIDPWTQLQKNWVDNNNLKLAKRPTGGGIIFHLWDLAFSLLIPVKHSAFSTNTLDNYAFVNNIVREAINKFQGRNIFSQLLEKDSVPLDMRCTHFCMAAPTIYDVMIDGRKAVGGAQRRTRHGFLHQGTICMTVPDERYLLSVLQPNSRVLEGMRQNSFSLLGQEKNPLIVRQAKQELQFLLRKETVAQL